MSTHHVEIVEIGEIHPHPDSTVTKLEITHVHGWQCCIPKGQYKKGDHVIYIEPDYCVPLSRPEFAFLKNKNNDGKTQERIKVRRFKGALSQGLIISVPDELKDLPVGSDVMGKLGIERYEPPLPKSTFGVFVGGPSGIYVPKFDVESYQRYRELFKAGEEVIVTEKIHGCVRGNTMVMLANGEYRAITELSAGDAVMSYDEDNGCFAVDTVTDVMHRAIDKPWVRLTFDHPLLDSACIECTADHLFLTQRGWVAAKDLTETDDIVEIKE